MSLAEKRALADQMRGEISQLRVDRETALQQTSETLAEAQLDEELTRLEAERKQALLEVELAKNGGSVEDAMAAMEAAAALEDKPSEDSVDNLSDIEEPAVIEPTAIEETPEQPVLLMPGVVGNDTQDGGK